MSADPWEEKPPPGGVSEKAGPETGGGRPEGDPLQLHQISDFQLLERVCLQNGARPFQSFKPPPAVDCNAALGVPVELKGRWSMINVVRRMKAGKESEPNPDRRSTEKPAKPPSEPNVPKRGSERPPKPPTEPFKGTRPPAPTRPGPS